MTASLDLPDEREYRYSLWVETFDPELREDVGIEIWASDEWEDCDAIGETLYGWRKLSMWIVDVRQGTMERF